MKHNDDSNTEPCIHKSRLDPICHWASQVLVWSLVFLLHLFYIRAIIGSSFAATIEPRLYAPSYSIAALIIFGLVQQRFARFHWFYRLCLAFVLGVGVGMVAILVEFYVPNYDKIRLIIRPDRDWHGNVRNVWYLFLGNFIVSAYFCKAGFVGVAGYLSTLLAEKGVRHAWKGRACAVSHGQGATESIPDGVGQHAIPSTAKSDQERR
ncbi:MAG: hypothetical protein HQL82_01965 [Magnetococcales bacterium]|nr:hypothetical protein [Magnetococcales bacterium]